MKSIAPIIATGFLCILVFLLAFRFSQIETNPSSDLPPTKGNLPSEVKK